MWRPVIHHTVLPRCASITHVLPPNLDLYLPRPDIPQILCIQYFSISRTSSKKCPSLLIGDGGPILCMFFIASALCIRRSAYWRHLAHTICRRRHGLSLPSLCPLLNVIFNCNPKRTQTKLNWSQQVGPVASSVSAHSPARRRLHDLGLLRIDLLQTLERTRSLGSRHVQVHIQTGLFTQSSRTPIMQCKRSRWKACVQNLS